MKLGINRWIWVGFELSLGVDFGLYSPKALDYRPNFITNLNDQILQQHELVLGHHDPLVRVQCLLLLL